jgi:hypothetical protein
MCSSPCIHELAPVTLVLNEDDPTQINKKGRGGEIFSIDFSSDREHAVVQSNMKHRKAATLGPVPLVVDGPGPSGAAVFNGVCQGMF